MARELVIRSLCDVCLAADKETPGDTYTIAVAIEGEAGSPRPFVVELCGEHGSGLANAVSALVSLGRAPDAGKAPKPRAARTAGDPVVCPACGHAALNSSTLRQHVRKEHDTSLAGVGFYPANFKCDDCGEPFPNRQGLAAHARTAHVKKAS